MTSRAERLLDWPIPERRHVYSRQDTAFYALSVGFGAGAPDRRLLPFVDPWREDLQALPSMALILGYPGFWLGEPDVAAKVGVTVPQILHVEQGVELHRPLPTAATVIGTTRVTGLADRGSERGTFLYTERLIVDAASGDLLATCRQTHLLRGVSGSGSTREPPPRTPSPAGEPGTVITLPTRPEQALFYRLNGDSNPLHIDPAVSSRAGFDTPILHGMCTIGVALGGVVQALTDYQPERIAAFSARMSSPTLPGDTLTVEAWPDGTFRTRVLARDVVVLDGGRVTLR
jgi:acyl dehydratase